VSYNGPISGTPLGGGASGGAKVTDSGHMARLERMLSPATDAAVGAGLRIGANAIVEEARFNLNSGAISGPGHIPGVAGGYSKSDTHELEKSLAVGETIEVADSIHTTAGAFGVPHAVYQELGTPTVLPRPNLQLATRARRGVVAPAVADELRRVRNAT
jgi:hypothetical protein